MRAGDGEAVGGQRPGRRDGQVDDQCPAGGTRGVGAPVPAARIDRTSAARNRLNATARRSAPTSASVPCAAPSASSTSSSAPSRVLPIAAAPTRNASASGAERAELLLGRGFRARTAVRCRAGPVVVLVEHGRSHRARPARGRRRSPRSGFDDQQPATVLHQPHRGADQPGRHRVPGRGEPHAGQPVDLPGHRRRPDLQPQRRQRAQHFSLDDQPLVGDRADLRVHRGVDLRAPRRRRRCSPRARSTGRPVDPGLGEQRDHQVALRVADTGSPRSPSIAGPGRGRSPGRTRSALPTGRSPGSGSTTFATTPPFRHAIRSARTLAGTPPVAASASAINASVVVARSSVANATNRHRDHASTAQNRCNPAPTSAQSITRYSPGAHTAGRRPR